MTNQINLSETIHPKTLKQRMLQGAGVAFILIACFITFLSLASDQPFHYSILLPLLTVPIAGAFGGLLYYSLDNFRHQESWKKVVVNIVNLLFYIAMLYMTLIVTFAVIGLWD
jgi:hypothetical protein